MEPTGKQQVYQLKVTLKGSKPPIWRRFQVAGDVTLHHLRLILQVVMGWTNSHLYQFEIEGIDFGEPDPESFYGLRIKNSKIAKLSKVAPRERAKFLYEYDFGDSWNHEILVERILPAEPGAQYPICLKGKRACPPEDCGGIPGYYHLLEVISDPAHEEHEEMMEWLGVKLDPDEFHLDEINESLKGYRVEDTAKTKRKIGRNDPCPCGSGKKYKRCCGKAPSPISSPSTQKLVGQDFRAMRRLMERDLRALQKVVERQDFESPDEAKTFLRRVTAKGDIPEWTPETLLEQAQELVYKALEATEKRERIRLAMDALRISQDCADAYVLLAEEAALVPEQARNWYQRGVEAGERALGPEIFAREAGNFWSLIETRPYMRAREGLADCLSFLGEGDAAVKHYWDMLRLNPNDSQGIRYKLLSCLMKSNNIGAAEELLEQFQDEVSAAWLFTRTLITFVHQGDTPEAREQLMEAMKENPHVVRYLLGQRQLPRSAPQCIGLGDKNEAIIYMAEFGSVWLDTPGVLEWIRSVSQSKT